MIWGWCRLGLLIFEDKKEVRLLVHEGLKLMDGCRVEDIEKPRQDKTRKYMTRQDWIKLNRNKLNSIELYQIKLKWSEFLTYVVSVNKTTHTVDVEKPHLSSSKTIAVRRENAHCP